MLKKLKIGENPEQSLENQKLFNYYLEAYGTILKDFLGEFEYKNKNDETVKTYGLKARCPIAKGYPFHHYDDFGARRTFWLFKTSFGA